MGRLSPRRRGEAGTGLVDVVVATGLLSVLVGVTASLLAGVGRAQLTVATRRYAEVVADNMASQAVSLGCGGATGYGTASQADALASRCAYGADRVVSLGDVLGVTASGTPVDCPNVAYQGLPGPACYNVPGLDRQMSAGLHLSWGFSGGAPACSSSLNGQAATPPDDLVATSTVTWADQSGQPSSVQATRVAPVPATLASAWAVGDMGAVAVSVNVTGPSPPSVTPVGLVVPSWAQAPSPPPDPITLVGLKNGSGCAIFAYVPAGSGYQVWVGSPSNLLQVPTVNSGEWTVVSS